MRAEEVTPGRPANWSHPEIRLILTDYFDMLKAQLAETRYNKTAHRNALMPKLAHRKAQAVEFKHCNISAVLHDLGLTYVHGYKPRSNYQHSLEVAVLEYLQRDPHLLLSISLSQSRPSPTAPDVSKVSIETVEVSAPKRANTGPTEARSPSIMITDWARIQLQTTALGKQGERFVLELERQFLCAKRRPDLAEGVGWISETEGDGAGYDIRSFDLSGNPKLIEVKTTNGGKNTPFYITANEIACSSRHSGEYWLYRVFEFSHSPRLYRMAGCLESTCALKPILFEAIP